MSGHIGTFRKEIKLMFVPEYLIEQTSYALYEVLLQYNEFVDLWIIGWKIALYVISPARLFSNTCFETQTSKVALGISQIESYHDCRLNSVETGPQ